MIPFPEGLFGQLAVRLGFLTPAALDEALRSQTADEQPPPPLGVLLVERGLLTVEQRAEVLRRQAEIVAPPPDAASARADGRLFGQIALARGYLDGETLKRGLELQARRAAEGAMQRLGEVLVELGALDFAAVVDVLEAQAHASGPPTERPGATVVRDSERPAGATVVRDSAPPAGATAILDTSRRPAPAHARGVRPGRSFGKYELVQELGRGGMGVVYKAYHPGLKSYFAVKVLLAGGEATLEDVRRFQREAQASARLRHPGIVAVHDIGEEEGKTYFAMEYVEGANLDRVAEVPTDHGVAAGPGGLGVAAGDALRIVREVALALQAAHDAGVVHRDLKPQNILLARGAPGAPPGPGRVKVTDFGLAKVVDASQPGTTRTGTVMGTPAYMSPEQAEGRIKEVDALSDVYQIGAILYELLTGHPPYEGAEAMAILLAVINDEPRAPRQANPEIDRDAETICLRAMARERSRRYASARELAEDCARALAGEAVRARRAGWWERPLRWARRRRLAAAFLLLATLASGVAGVAGLAAWRARVERERLFAEVLDGLRAAARMSVNAALELRRAGAKRSVSERTLLPELEAAVERALRQAPELAEPYFHRGRMYRALDRRDAAVADQDEAIRRAGAAGADATDRALLAWARYERGALRAIAYLHAVESGRARLRALATAGGGGPGGAVAVATAAEVDAAFPEVAALRRATVEDLEAAAAGADAEPAAQARAEAARGMAALLLGRPEAHERLEAAVKRDPALEVGFLLLGLGASERRDWPESVRWAEAGHRADRGHLPLALLLLQSLDWAAEMERAAGRDGDALRRRAFEAGEEIRAVHDDDPDVCRALAALHYHDGQAAEARSADPGPAYEAALGALARSLQQAPGVAESLLLLGSVRQSLAERRSVRGEDPSGELKAALEAFAGAAAIAGETCESASGRSLALAARVRWKRQRGEDAGADVAAALAAHRAAMALRPGMGECTSNLAAFLAEEAAYKGSRGEDPREDFMTALGLAEKAAAQAPGRAPILVMRARIHTDLGRWHVAQGEDPRADFERAAEALDRALQLDPGCWGAALDRANLFKAVAAWRREAGQDPRADFESARAGYERLLAAMPGFTQARNNLGTVHVELGDLAFGRGEDPTEDWDRALDQFGQVLAERPAAWDVAFNRGMVTRKRGEWKAERGVDPVGDFDAALADFAVARAGAPAHGLSCLEEAQARAARADWLTRANQDPRPGIREAIALAERACALDPVAARSAQALGSLWKKLAEYEEMPGGDPRPALAQALAAYDRALALQPDYPQAANNRANALRQRAHWLLGHREDPRADFAAAVEGYADALRADPGLWMAHVNRGLTLELLGRLGPAAEAYEAALRVGGERAAAAGPMLARVRADAAARQEAGMAGEGPGWLDAFFGAQAAARGGDPAAARRGFVQAFALAPQRIEREPWFRAAAAETRYDLGRLFALAAAGREAPRAAIPPAAEEAEALRAEAFSQLEAAVALGWRDGARLAAEPDLAELRGDPRWAALARRAGGK